MSDFAFDAPGAGMWDLDRSHYPGGTTPISQWLMEGCPNGMRGAFEEFGIPAETLDVRFVHGFMYTRLRPLIMPDKSATKQPPLPLLKLAVRLHPVMRRRAKSAARTLEERPWRKVVADWNTTTRPRLERENAVLADVDSASLDDDALADHVDRLLSYLRANFELHFYLHVFDLGPIGMLLQACMSWGIEPPEVIPALTGASPSTSAPAMTLTSLRRLVGATGARPSNLNDVRRISPEADTLLGDYLRRRGRVMVTRYDLDGQTLDEKPDLVLSTILDGADPAGQQVDAALVATRLRARVPADQQAAFDERLGEARAAMDLRDDNGPNTVELPMGLLRHALLEAGRRLSSNGRLHQAEHVLELNHDEASPLISHHSGPSADELAGRAARRRREAALNPPDRLGPEEKPPPVDILAPAHQVMVGAVNAVLVHLGMAGDERTEALKGCGIGTAPYRGRARVATDPESALQAMDPGDVLVVRFTTPAYNTVLAIAGAIVTADGALLCHAAVMARELGIPAIVGARGALQEIPDGAEIEVDPVAGVVRVLDASPAG